MEYMSTKEATDKWNISERRIRKLLQEGRIEGSNKINNNWFIPIDATKPIDKRIKSDLPDFIIDIDENNLKFVDSLKDELNSFRHLPKKTLESLNESKNLEWTYNSNGIEGNTLTLRETQIVLEGITVGGKTIKEHLEVINHKEAIDYLEDLIKDDNPITEWNIKNLHGIILKGIDDSNNGRYRLENVRIVGANHIPPNFIKINELMEKLIINYKEWDSFHPIIKASLLHGELVKIHPFIDGNGRISRLIMNLSLMKDGYLPIIIKKEKKLDYYEALDKAHVNNDYSDFIKLIINEETIELNDYIELLKY